MSAIELTQTQWNVYSYLLTASGRDELPTFEQIGAACGMRSKNQVGRVFRQLCDKGLIRRRKYKRRAFTLIRASVAMRPRVDRREAVQG